MKFRSGCEVPGFIGDEVTIDLRLLSKSNPIEKEPGAEGAPAAGNRRGGTK